MTARSQARDEAVALLLAAGWEQERIRQALGIGQALVRQLVAKASHAPLHSPPSPIGEGCCAEIFMPKQRRMRYCDRPVLRPGEVYCATHHHGGVWRPQDLAS